MNLILLAVFLLDEPVSTYLLRTPSVLKPIGSFVTDAGKSGWILMVSALLFGEALTKARLVRSAALRLQAFLISHVAAYVFLTVALSGLAANLAKRMIGRVRPLFAPDGSAFGFSPLHGSYQFESFPSGHATTVGALMMALALMAPAWRVDCLVLGLWLGFSRVIVGAHYPSDVIAGLVFGAWFSIVTATAFARYGLLFTAQDGSLPKLCRPLPLSLPPRRRAGRWRTLLPVLGGSASGGQPTAAA
ncbi:phosphatase PAP2 family protein [Rhizobium sp. SGZ-381]|uniref:phosphatase PAP2 family protein n=1 Tax=Rhizobium sp. SGZ-381 TaxID=3342800 RepID=UPI00366DAD4B